MIKLLIKLTSRKKDIAVSMNINNELFKRQLELEQEGINKGIQKFRDDVTKAIAKGSFSETKIGTIVIYELMQPYCKGIIEYVSKRDKSIKDKEVKDFIVKSSVEKAAFISLRVIIANMATGGITLLRLCRAIARAIHDDIMLEEFKKSEKNWGGYVKDTIKAKTLQNSAKDRTMAALKARMQALGFVAQKLDEKVLFEIGQKLLDIFIMQTGLVKLVTKGGKRDYRIEPTRELLEHLDKIGSSCELLNPLLYPMLIKPNFHAKAELAGFLTPTLRVPLVKDYYKRTKRYLRELEMPQVYEAINRIQAVAWRINKEVLSVFTELVNRGKVIPELDIVSSDEVCLPPKSWGVLDDAQWQEYKKANAERILLGAIK